MWSSPDGPADVAIKTLKNEATEVEKVKFLESESSFTESLHDCIHDMMLN